MSVITAGGQTITPLLLEEHPEKEANPVFEITVSPYWESMIKEISGEKLDIPKSEIKYNGDLLAVKSLKTRGNTTLYFRRKSFLVSLEERLQIDGRKIKKLALNNLAMDQNYYRNRLSFLLMKELGIFLCKAS